MSEELAALLRLYETVGPAALVFSTFMGFTVGIFGEVAEATSFQSETTAISSFVNITGCTSIGIISGLFWPIAMPLLSMGAIYNKSFYKRKNNKTI